MTSGPEKSGEGGQSVQVMDDGGQAHTPGEDEAEAGGWVGRESQPLPVLNTDPTPGA